MTDHIIEQLRPLAVAIDTLVSDPANARLHDERNIEAIKGSLAQFGQRKPIVVKRQGNIVIAGNGTMAAAKALGWDTIAAVMVDDDATMATAYAIADNRTAELARWDDQVLGQLLGGLGDTDIDMTALGFTEQEINNLLGELEVTPMEQGDPDDIPEARPDAVSQRGEVYELGPHRLMCGDSTSAEDWQALMGGERADVCLTYPPYGLADTKSDKNKYDTHNDTEDALQTIIEKALPIMNALSDVVVLTPGNKNSRMWPNPTWTMAWFTPAGTGRGPWGFCCWQPILCYGKDPKLANGEGSHPDAIVHTERASSDQHPCAKPIKLWVWIMERVSSRGDIILEPFGGSGTTLIAAAQTGRRCRAMEISPHYCDVIRRRWTKFAKENGAPVGTGGLE